MQVTFDEHMFLKRKQDIAVQVDVIEAHHETEHKRHSMDLFENGDEIEITDENQPYYVQINKEEFYQLSDEAPVKTPG